MSNEYNIGYLDSDSEIINSNSDVIKDVNDNVNFKEKLESILKIDNMNIFNSSATNQLILKSLLFSVLIVIIKRNV